MPIRRSSSLSIMTHLSNTASWLNNSLIGICASERPGMTSYYYDNPITRHVWRQAGEALALAERVILVGYSLPATDLVTSGMLGSHLASRKVPVVVINPEPEEVVERLLFNGIEKGAIEISGGTDCVRSFVSIAEKEAVRSLASTLGPALDRSPVMIAWSEATAAAVIGIQRGTSDPSIVELMAEQPTSIGQAARPRHGPEPQPIQGHVLRQELEVAATQVVAVFPSGGRRTVIDRAQWTTDTGFAGRWTILVPAGAPLSV